ncbi:MAG: SDR family oxidoreductase [Bacteroidetes bacterium]|jgi:short-subunit dehydrogenase|nr:SDR family oxidoreductase [Bacteroidota bacterium]
MNVLITGHSKGVGKSITECLLDKGFFVTGISRTEIKNHQNLTQHQIDLGKETEIIKICNILQKNKFDVLILNAGYNFIKPAESYTVEEIFKITNVNYTSGAVILRTCLPNLLKVKGKIIGIGSVSGKEIAKWNNYYGSSKAAFIHLLNNYFEQYRKQGLKVTTVIPDIINSDFYKQQEFETGIDPETFISVKDISDLVIELVESNKSYIVNEIVIKPQRFELNRKK